jgi:hypothetical protein
MMEAIEALKAARGLMSAENWIKFHQDSGDGKHCALGYLARALGQSGIDGDHPAACLLALGVPVNFRPAVGIALSAGWLVAEYNNAPDTKFQDVEALFDRAIAKATQ